MAKSFKLNLKRVFLTGECLVFLIFLVVSNIVVKSRNVSIKPLENQAVSECYTLALDDGLTLTYDEYNMVCCVVQGETGGADVGWSELVAQVIKNRLYSDDFPDTIYEILTQPNQFDAIENYYDGIDVNSVTCQAVTNVFTDNAYSTERKLNGAVYYCNPDILDDDVVAWFDDNLTKTYDACYTVDGYTFRHVFYK